MRTVSDDDFKQLEVWGPDAVPYEMCRVAGAGIYIADLSDRFPGGYPRVTFGLLLRERGFNVRGRHIVFQTPFEEEPFPDPKPLWPMCKVQNLWAKRDK